MTKAEIEERLRELLIVPGATLLFLNGKFVIYSAVEDHGRPCSGTGATIQQAIFSYDQKRRLMFR